MGLHTLCVYLPQHCEAMFGMDWQLNCCALTGLGILLYALLSVAPYLLQLL